MKILLLFLLCLVYLIESITTESEELKFQYQVNCFQYFQNCFSLQGDEENYSNVQHIDNNILQKSFQIPYKQEPILTRIIDSLYTNKIQEKLTCYYFLIMNIISCINFDLVQFEEQNSPNEILRFETKISSQELCFEMYESNDGSLRLFCLNQCTLKNYQVNLFGNTTLILEYDASDQISDCCKTKQKMFYQCSKWKVLMIQNQEVKIILEASMKNKETQLQSYSFIQDVSFWEYIEFQQILYLVENFEYLKIHFSQPKLSRILLIQKSQSIIKNSIDRIIILKRCQNKIIEQQYLVFKIFLALLQINRLIIFTFNRILFSNQLNVSNFQYFITLHFLQFNNLFCQFDKNVQVAQFYKFTPISSVISPKRNDLFRQKPFIKCYKIINSTTALNENYNLVYKVIQQNACSNNLQTRQTSRSFDFIKDLSFNLNNNGGSVKMSINNTQEIQESCIQQLQQFYFQGNIEFISIKLPLYISIQNETKFLFIITNKINQLNIQTKLNLMQISLLESNGNIYIFNKIDNNLLLVFSQQQCY